MSDEQRMHMTEAPISVTLKLAYKGIEILATKRDEKELIKPYLEATKVAIDWALENGFEVPAPRFPKKEMRPVEYVEGKMCPTDGARLVYFNKKDGGKAFKCENNKYINGQQSGCTYIDWGNKPQGQNRERYEGDF